MGKEASSEEGNNALLDKGRGRADDVHIFDGEWERWLSRKSLKKDNISDGDKDMENFLIEPRKGLRWRMTLAAHQRPLLRAPLRNIPPDIICSIIIPHLIYVIVLPVL